MKKNILFLLINCITISLLAQEIILSEQVIESHRARNKAFSYDIKANPHLIDSALKAYEQLFQWIIPGKTWSFPYMNYADLLAQAGDLKRAVQYYDTALYSKKMSAEDFGIWYREKYFEKDTLLFNEKKREYYEKPISYTARELECLIEVKEILANDQFARHYLSDYPQHKSCSKNIIVYGDSITMVKIIELFNKYPEYDDPLDIDFWASWVIGRHIFTGYPEFWLTYYESKARKKLLEGSYDPQSYARTYDRCVITSGQAQYSYYGEWDDDGKNTNPDSISVDKRRANLGLPLMKEKIQDDRKIFITY